MAIDFEELAWSRTPIGELSLRRRMHVSLAIDVYEVKLDDDFLMSSLFTAGEIALATIGLASLRAEPLDVLVGGLGLGYTARAVLDHPGVRSLVVVEALPDVIDWHRRGLVPLGPELTGDPRCHFVNGDFFASAQSGTLDPADPGRRFDAVLVDIDHSPSAVLHPTHGSFYGRDGLKRLAGQIAPGGVFALWSNDPPEPMFIDELAAVFPHAEAQVVTFPNPLLRSEAANTIYVGRLADPGP